MKTNLGVSCVGILVGCAAQAATNEPALPAWNEPWARNAVVYRTTAEGAELRVVVFKPEGWKASDQRAALVYMHAGGFYRVAMTENDPQWRPFLDAGMVLFVPQYRLVAKALKVEDAAADVKSFYRWLRTHAGEYGVDPKRIVGSGESAGACLTAAAALVDGLDDPRDDLAVSCRPDALFLFRPVLDVTQGKSEKYGKMCRDAAGFSPALHVSDRTPPTYIIQGTADGFLHGTRTFQENAKGKSFPLTVDILDGMSHTSRPPEFYQVLNKRGLGFLRQHGFVK
jgi:acetyl esterase/lipase